MAVVVVATMDRHDFNVPPGMDLLPALTRTKSQSRVPSIMKHQIYAQVATSEEQANNRPN